MRLRKSDLIDLAEVGTVIGSLRFLSGQVFLYSLSIEDRTEELEASYIEQELKVSLPTEVAENWINSNQVGIEKVIELAAGETLHVLVEKDFPCLDRENEDKSDTFWELVPEDV